VEFSGADCLLTRSQPDKDRLQALDARLRAAKGRERRDGPEGKGHLTQVQAGWRMVTELLAGIGIGFAMGWGMDSLLGTQPLFIVVMTLLGFAAGIKVMLATAAEITAQAKRAAARQAKRPDTGSE
jgi:ATP synthase protein I